ncbi:uncharacterized protein RHIMIDRAFT_263765 [Rhizopus microsporus ATCC 52813]|uniref:Uncharacterized protein n=1 Tax=Rhizopus microsporus ATCC 52813 TaxID=1340429 RepID=A0A2G4SJS4_RHIZD|nr:uncharacterized protein RHIMIDRAFT_263765 [Rhizopus microsporus ATCC 52813]PHZ09027.1 hypothetical protein RHIMIDRAFT_263765 [Rhizopus microsporus ATCC 52813]
MEISWKLAICMYYYAEYTEENVKKYTEEIKRLGDVEICYNIDPKQPIIVTKERIRKMPNSYQLYPATLD